MTEEIKREITEKDIDDVAKLYVNNNSSFQAGLFNKLGKSFRSVDWDAYFQMTHVIDGLDNNGRWFVESMGHFLSLHYNKPTRKDIPYNLTEEIK